MIRLPLVVAEANCGAAQDPVKSAPPVNLATGALLVMVTADPIVPVAVADLDADVPFWLDFVDELETADLDKLRGEQPTKLGMVTLTEMQSFE